MAPDSDVSSEAQSEDLVRDIINDNEVLHGVFTGPDGLTRIEGGKTHSVTCTIRVVVTEQRVLFVADSPGGGVEAGSLAYGHLASAGIDDETLVFTKTDGTRFELDLPDSPSETVEAAKRHLAWLGQVRSQIIACQNDLDLTVGEIHDHAAAREWALASGEYESFRETLDQLVVAVQLTDPVPDDELAPELTEMEQTIERARAQTFLERARSELELGRQLVDNDNYDQAWSVLASAMEYHDRAAKRANAIEPPEAFRFGEQRELQEDIEQVGDEIDSIAVEPIERAERARQNAREADDPAVEPLETALGLYGSVLEMEWGTNGRYFPGDREEIRAERETVADQLIGHHRELAREAWDAGSELRDDGKVKRALEECETALSHQERARDLATIVRSDTAEAIENRRHEMEQTIKTIRDTAEADSTTGTDPSADGDDATTGETDPSNDEEESDELTDIDTHQEITLDATVEDESSDTRLDVKHQTPPGTGSNSQDENPLAGIPSSEGADAGNEESTEDEDLTDLTKAIIQSDPAQE